MSNEPLLQVDLPGINKLKSGKVREIFDLGDRLLMVATDRISAFDVIMPNGIPRKGEVLTQISHFWFERCASWQPNHLLARSNDPLPPILQPFAAQLARRSMIVKKAKPLAIECVVRGYLAGSGWKEYRQSQTVCGIELPAGLTESAELPEPIFTPATKAEAGHDENIPFAEAENIVGADARRASSRRQPPALPGCPGLCPSARHYHCRHQVRVRRVRGQADPDRRSADPGLLTVLAGGSLSTGRGQPSFDKQFLRDYLETLDWNKQPPGPQLPADVVQKTSEKYLDAYRRITGRSLEC